MKHKRNYAAAFLLSLFCAWAAVGCLVTAFAIPLESDLRLAAAWALGCIACMAILTVRRGGWLLLGVNAVLAATLWRWDALRSSTVQLLHCIAVVYDSAYGWGIPNFLPAGNASYDPAVMLLGMIVTECVCVAVLRRHGSWLASASLILTLAVCLVVTDTVPVTPCLFGLLLGLVLLLLTDNVRAESTQQGVHLLAFSLLPAALALGLLFYAFPQEAHQAPVRQLREQALDYVRRIPEKLQNAELPLQLFNRPPQRVALEALPTQPQLGLPVAETVTDWDGTLYLRVKDYDTYTGTAWTSSASRLENISGNGPRTGSVVVRELNDQGSTLLPAFPAGDTLLSDGTASMEEKVYRVECMEEALSARPGENWLALPEATALRVGALLNQLPGTLSEPRSAAEAIGDYVRSCAIYDRSPANMPEGEADFAAWFLESGDRGYCVHFATAAAVLLRSAGIPARYVTGYRVDAAAGETVRVTSNDAHAWAEYYDDQTWSWVILEATPPDFVEDGPSLPTQQTTFQTEPVPPRETRPTPTAQTQPIPEHPLPEGKRQFPVKALLWIFPVIVLLSLVEVQHQLRIRLRRRRQKRGSANARALKLWQETMLLHRLLKEAPPEELTALAEKAMFSQHALTAAELHTFTAAASRCRRSLRKAKWFRQVLYRYWYAVI